MFVTKRTLLRTLERERNAHAEQVAQLVETICHLAGKPQQIPKSQNAETVKVAERRFISRPELLPDE